MTLLSGHEGSESDYGEPGCRVKRRRQGDVLPVEGRADGRVVETPDK